MKNTTQLLDDVAFIQRFAEMKNPYNDKNLECAFTDEEIRHRNNKNQEWIEAKKRFRALTGSYTRYYPGALNRWAKASAKDLTRALDRQELGELAIWAAGSYQTELLAQLVRRDPSLTSVADARGDTVYHAAAWAQNDESLRWLLSYARATIQPLNNEGRTAMECLLLSRNIDKGQPWRKNRHSGNARECLKVIYETDRSWIEQRLEGGNTPLHVAAGTWRPRSICQDLVGYGLAWNETNAAGFTPADVLENNRFWRPNPDQKKDKRDARFVAEAVEAGKVPLVKPGFLARTLFRIGRM